MNLESIILSEISQIEKEKYCLILLICRLYKEKQQQKNPKKWNSEKECIMKLPGAGRWRKQVEVGKQIQSCSFKVNKVQGPIV